MSGEMNLIFVTTKSGGMAAITETGQTITMLNGQYVVCDNIAKGAEATPTDEQRKAFEDGYNAFFAKKEAERLAKISESKAKEDARIAELKTEIAACKSFDEFCDRFNLKIVSRINKIVFCQYAATGEILEMAGCSEFGIAKKRDGQSWHYEGATGSSFNQAQESLRDAIRNDDKLFYKSHESEQEFLCDRIADVMDSDDSNEDKIEAVREMIASFDAIEPGYYDCNGNVYILDSDLDCDDFSGFCHDVYSYSISADLGDVVFKNEDEN